LTPFIPVLIRSLFARYVDPSDLHSFPTRRSSDLAKCVESTVEIAVQVNGKVRARLSVPADITAEDAIATAKAEPAVAEALAGKTDRKSTRLNSSHVSISYAVFCLKKKTTTHERPQ